MKQMYISFSMADSQSTINKTAFVIAHCISSERAGNKNDGFIFN